MSAYPVGITNGYESVFGKVFFGHVFFLPLFVISRPFVSLFVGKFFFSFMINSLSCTLYLFFPQSFALMLANTEVVGTVKFTLLYT